MKKPIFAFPVLVKKHFWNYSNWTVYSFKRIPSVDDFLQRTSSDPIGNDV